MKTFNREHLGDELANIRASRDYTQRELALALGVAQTAVSRWEAGNKNMKIDTIVRVARFLGMRLEFRLVPIAAEVDAPERGLVGELYDVFDAAARELSRGLSRDAGRLARSRLDEVRERAMEVIRRDAASRFKTSSRREVAYGG